MWYANFPIKRENWNICVQSNYFREKNHHQSNGFQDAKLGISRATSLFVLYIAQAAMENANDNKRKTVKESDVTKALEGKFF